MARMSEGSVGYEASYRMRNEMASSGSQQRRSNAHTELVAIVARAEREGKEANKPDSRRRDGVYIVHIPQLCSLCLRENY